MAGPVVSRERCELAAERAPGDHSSLVVASTRIVAVLALAAAMSACAVALRSAGDEPGSTTKSRAARAGPAAAPTPIATAQTTIRPSTIPTFVPMTPEPLATFIHMTIEDAAELGAAGATHAPSPAPGAATPLAAVAPLAVATPAAAAAPIAPVAAPARVTGNVALQRRGDLRVARARLAGRDLGDVLLDTGAGDTFIDRRRADEAGLRELIAASTEDKRDDDDARVREIQGLALDDLLLAEDRAFTIDLDATDASATGPLAGVIGFATLAVRPFTLDFPNDTLIVHSETTFEPPAGPAQAIRVDQGLPFVDAVLADGTSVWLLLDTGASVAVGVWRGFATQHPGMVKSSTDASGTPASELRGVQLLGETYDRLPVAVEGAPTRAWQRARVVGRVGMGWLRDFSVTVHPTTERIWLERAAGR